MLDSPSITVMVIDARGEVAAHLRNHTSDSPWHPVPTTIREVADAGTAIDLLASDAIDAIVFSLPGRSDDSRTVQQLYQAAIGVPIIVATDAANEPAAFDAVRHGAQDYVVRDLDDVRIIWRTVRHAVERAVFERRREALLVIEHGGRLAAERARDGADRARVDAEALERRASFLSDAGTALSATLDPRAILTTATRLVVPTLARAAAAFIAGDDGVLKLLDTAGASPRAVRKLAIARRLISHEPPDRVLSRARRDGFVVVDSHAGLLRSATRSGRRSGLTSARCVLIPLRAHDRCFGVLLLVGGRHHQYGTVDVELVEAFGKRVGAALDNACVFDASRRAIRTRDQVLAIVSHDLRNPMGAIAMGARALREDTEMPDRERIRLLTSIGDAADWTQRLLGDLVDVASIEAGRLPIHTRRVDPIVLLSKSLDLFETGQDGVAVRLAPDTPESLPMIIADEDRLLQVIGNLISNARKATRAGGVIALDVGVVGDMVRFAVTDTGPGIAPEHLPHIFDWFWRASHERAEHGTGLGLAIARGIVEAHGGHIEVESTPGEGARFSFTIPTARRPSVQGGLRLERGRSVAVGD